MGRRADRGRDPARDLRRRLAPAPVRTRPRVLLLAAIASGARRGAPRPRRAGGRLQRREDRDATRSSASGSSSCSRHCPGSCSSRRVIPWVDIASVYRGPTRVVVEERAGDLRAHRGVLLAAGRGRGGAARAARHPLLRAVPRDRRPFRPPRRRDVGRDDRQRLGDARRDVRLRPGRPPGAARGRARLPRSERRPAVAPPQGPGRGVAASRRQRSRVRG